jgi:thiamine biosynthesis lipoprotein
VIKYLSLVIFATSFFISGCLDKNNKVQFSGQTMGTSYHITIADKLNKAHIPQELLQKKLDQLLVQVNQQMSTYSADSEITRFNQSTTTDWFPVSKNFVQVVATAQEISKTTQGAFDITVAPLVDIWGFGKDNKTKLPEKKQLERIKQSVGYRLLEYRSNPPALLKQVPELRIDLSAIAKGFAVDKLSHYLHQQNYKNFMVEIGGEIRVSGKNTTNSNWKIAIQSPDISNKSHENLLLITNQSIATSGNYLNYFVKDGIRYSHILDPRTGQPESRPPLSITVLHTSSMVADAYATALMVLGEEQGKSLAKRVGLETYWVSQHTLKPH